MSSGPDNITQTTRTEPSKWLLPNIQTASANMGAQFGPYAAPGTSAYGADAPAAASDPYSNIPYGEGSADGLGGVFGRLINRLQYQRDPNAFLRGQAVQPTQPPTMGGGGISEGGISLMGGGDGFGIAPGTPYPDVPTVMTPPTEGEGDIGVPTDPYDLLEQRGRQGNPLVDEASDLLSRTMAGDFLDPSTNPWLESTFNRAADLTRTRLDSEFAGGGRNLGAAMPARSQELQTLANSLYGQNYARERGMQQGAINAALPFAANDFTDINAVLDAQNLPLDTLINRISALAPAAGGTAVSSQPLQRNQLGSAIGGAASLGGLGAALGAMPGVGWGLAGLGGLLGLLG